MSILVLEAKEPQIGWLCDFIEYEHVMCKLYWVLLLGSSSVHVTKGISGSLGRLWEKHRLVVDS